MLDGPLVMGYESKIAGDQCVYGIYSVRQRVFIYSAFVKYVSWKHCLHQFCKKHPALRVPSKRTNTEQ